MKKMIAFFFALVWLLSLSVTAFAAEGKVTYRGKAGDFVFRPGSSYSLTDLFPDFKGVMPGDTLTQKITVKNNADNKVKVKLYLRSLGAQEGSEEFLSQLGLKVAKSSDNEMAYMFDAAADETAGLTDWVCLGTLYSGGEVDLDVTLSVPISLDNAFQNKIGYLDWEFMAEEFPAEPEDPDAPPTGDTSDMGLWAAAVLCTSAALLLLLIWRKKEKEKEENAAKR